MKSFISRKKIFSLSTALFLSFSLVFSSLISIIPAKAADPPKEKAPLELTIFHLNDTHARVGESKIDFAKIAGEVDLMRQNKQNVLLLDAGDTFHGKPIANLYNGYSIVQIMNTMNYDAMVPGNHDFNYGYTRLVSLSKLTNFPILAANVKVNQKNLVGDYIIKEFDGYKVGIFGVSTPETLYKSHPDNIGGIEIWDPIKSSKEMVKILQQKNCDYIIALGHIGVDGGTIIKSTDICNAVPQIDLFIDGHSHTTLLNGIQTQNGIVASTGYYANKIGFIKVSIQNGEKSTRVDLLNESETQSWPSKSDTATMIQKYKDEVAKKSSEIIGKTDIELVGEREVVRKGESNLGNLIVDATRIVSKADVALSNGGNVRATIPVGDITYGNILEVLPFGNVVVLKKIKGNDIISALEIGVSEYPAASGGFIHISGGKYSFDSKKPIGKRIVSVEIGGKPIDKERVYIVATNDFLAAGGDKSTLGNGTVYGELGPMDDLVLKYIKENGVEIVTKDVEPRIVEINSK